MSSPDTMRSMHGRIERAARRAAERRDRAIARQAPLAEVQRLEAELDRAERAVFIARLEASGW